MEWVEKDREIYLLLKKKTKNCLFNNPKKN